MEPWENVVQIPEGKSGDYEIKHVVKPAGCSIPISNIRTRFFGQSAHDPIVFDRETTWHQLLEGGAVWMTDYPIEQVQHDLALKDFEGDVLVGGLGLGYAVNILAANPDVSTITVVEISQDVIDLVGPHIKDPQNKVTIIHSELLDYLKSQKDEWAPFDWAFYDIWTSDGEGTFHEIVMPLREASAVMGMEDDQVVCWNEDIMRAQLSLQLHSRLNMLDVSFDKILGQDKMTLEDFAKGRGSIYQTWAQPFWQALLEEKIPQDLRLSAANVFAGLYGRSGWVFLWNQFTENPMAYIGNLKD